MQPLRIDNRTIETIDLAPVAEFFAKRAFSSLGRERVMARRPMAGKPEEFAREQALIREYWSLRDENDEEPPLSPLFDARPLFDLLAAPNSVLVGVDLIKIGRIAGMAQPVRNFTETRAAKLPLIGKIAALVTPLGDVPKAISRVVDDDGRVKDHASPELARVRAELRRMEGRAQSEISRLARQFGISGVLSDTYHTIRSGRLVLPVQASRRSSVPGIVHGRSATGETVFIEPMEVVEATNDIAELEAVEAEEVRRVLAELTAAIRPRVGDLRNNLELFAELDDLVARGRASWENGWRLPRHVAADEPLKLDRAHHPLLWIQRKEASVPISLTLRRKDSIILLSGPNAGGKTTTLKLAGLALALAQAGFPIPCGPDTELPVVRGVALSIGDEQSVKEGESTFSAHVRRLGAILESTAPGSLVLLDEIASGTDPTEGGALAIATLEELVRRGARVLCTSHLRPLIEWAESFEGARNASFRLDPQSHRPTFELTLDVPGSSNALFAAERFGFPSAVVERARQLIPKERLQAAELVETLQAKNKQADERTRALALDTERMEKDRVELDRKLAELREEKRAFRERMLAEKSRDVQSMRAEVEKRIAALPSREGLLEGRAKLEEAAQSTAREARDLIAERPAAETTAAAGELRPGGVIYVRPLRGYATVLEIDAARGTARVDLRGLQVEMRVDQLSANLSLPPTTGPSSDVAGFDRALDGEEPLPPPTPAAAPTRNPLLGIAKVEGRGLFRRRQEEEAKAIEAAKPKGRAKSKKNQEYDDEAFFATTIAKPGAKRTPPRKYDDDAPPPPPASISDQGGVRVRRANPAAVSQSITLDLHGRRVEEALRMVDEFLDDAILSDWPLARLMHGVGTGALQRAIREHLKLNPVVKKSYPATSDDGGSGITIVEFK
jgi:DNA mismatch repair protein MutS2